MIEESTVPETLTGELFGLAGLPRNASVVMERAAVPWYLGEEASGRESRIGTEFYGACLGGCVLLYL